MRFSNRIKRTTRQYITVAVICTIIIGGAAIITSFIITGQIRQEYDYQLAKLNQEKEENQRLVYIAVNEIKCGDILTEDKLLQQLVYASQPQNTYMTEEGIGKAALLDIPAGAHIQENMLTEYILASELREVEFYIVQISTNIMTNDMVDIRIVYPNGEDFTVLSKKAIKRQEADIFGCFLWLSEEEIIRMQSAIIDAYLYTGAYLYTTKYIEPNIQKASVVNYEPSVEAINLIIENPNIIHTAANELSITVRKALENRLTRSLQKDVTVKQWNLEDDYIYQDYENPISLYDTENNINSVKEIEPPEDMFKRSANEEKEIIEDIKQDDYDIDSIDFLSPELGKNIGNIGYHDIEELTKDEDPLHKRINESNQGYSNDSFIITEG